MLVPYSLFKEMVSAVALGNGERVIKAIEPMHGTMEKTKEAVNQVMSSLKKLEQGCCIYKYG
ncbi:MAG: hypothetical protein RBT37_02880 [Dissulfurispiraceae bacterium]|jgi:hypothetical protein|nr:hypothetical protein [Dissulfurispiraceae bacterium]